MQTGTYLDEVTPYMRRKLSVILMQLLLGAALAGCTSAPPPPPPTETVTAPAPAPEPAPTPAPPPAGDTPVAAPLPAGPCTPGATAADLPSGPYGSGITLKPPQPGGTPERPWLGFLSVDQTDVWEGGGSMLGTIYMRKGGTATVDTGEFWLRGLLMPAPPEGWHETHFKLEGVQPLAQNQTATGQEGRFDLRIPAGRPGESFRLTLKDVLTGDGSSGDISVTFCRQAPPQATVAYRAGDEWRPVGTQVPADTPLVLRLTFTHDMLPETVERALKGPHDKEGRSQGDWITSLKWIDARTLELTADQPQPLMQLNLHGAQERHGLYLTGGIPSLYTGTPPQVFAVDPASGQAGRIADLTPEPRWADLSPDGKLLRVTSQQVRGGHESPTWQHSLIDLTTGQSQAVKPEDTTGYWLPSGELIAIRREGETTLVITRQTAADPQRTVLPDLPPYDSFYLSPNGEWLAVLVQTGEYTPDSYVGVRFLILSIDGRTRQTLAGDARMWRPGKDGITLYGPAWSPDSSRLALTQPAGGGTALMVADLAAGALRTVAGELPGSRGSFDPVAWSPDGSKILVGPLLLNAVSGQVERRIEGVRRLPFFSPNGQWLLFQPDEWTEITAYNLRTGQSAALGVGLALGWSQDGKALLIRWPGAAHRTRWGI